MAWQGEPLLWWTQAWAGTVKSRCACKAVLRTSANQEPAYLSGMQASYCCPGPTELYRSSSEGGMLTMPAAHSSVAQHSSFTVKRQPDSDAQVLIAYSCTTGMQSDLAGAPVSWNMVPLKVPAEILSCHIWLKCLQAQQSGPAACVSARPGRVACCCWLTAQSLTLIACCMDVCVHEWTF